MNTNVIERQCASCKHCIEIANGAYVCDLHQKRIALNDENKRGWISESCTDLISENAKNEQPKKVWVQGKGARITDVGVQKTLLYVSLFLLIMFILQMLFLKGGEKWLWNF